MQKNYFLHQSARDGYRSYLQSYASYSLKKIFDVNQLDLAKVGKAFGFSVPPRVNVNIGGGKGGTGRTGMKRRREDADGHEDEWEDVDGASDGNDGGKNAPRRRGKDRRIETLGRKKVDKEVYRKSIQKQGPQGQWSR